MEFQKLNEFQRLLLKWKDFETYKDYKFHRKIHEKPPVNINHPFKKETHFKHSGNIGDIIYSLPAVFSLAKNGKALMHLYLNQGSIVKHDFHPLGHVMLNQKVFEMFRPFLLYQPLIDLVDIYSNQQIDYDLDLLRHYPMNQDKGSISRWYFHIFNIFSNLSKPWLIAPKNNDYADYIVIARSHRYRAPGISYNFLKKYSKKIFIGVQEEFKDMKQQLPELQYLRVNNFLEMSAVINGCKLFIGNQSFPFSLAEGLKVNRLIEIYYAAPNVIVEGEGGHDFLYQEHFEKAVEMLYQ